MTEKPVEMRSGSRMVLVASVVLNLFLVAVIAGHLLRTQAAPPPGQSILARALANAEATLSPTDAAAFGGVLKRDAPQHVDAIKGLDDARGNLENRILAEPYDPQAVQAAFKTWQASWDHFVEDISPTVVDALARVSPEGREKLVAERRKATGIFRTP
jgi:uncharacterized membrane protein